MLIHPFSSNWDVQFERIRAVLASGLKGLSVDIKHVGSTAVIRHKIIKE